MIDESEFEGTSVIHVQVQHHEEPSGTQFQVCLNTL